MHVKARSSRMVGPVNGLLYPQNRHVSLVPGFVEPIPSHVFGTEWADFKLNHHLTMAFDAP